MKTHDEIVALLVSEALDERDTGWLSDMGGYRLEYDDANAAIRVGNGSIDVGHLASIIQEIQEGLR